MKKIKELSFLNNNLIHEIENDLMDIFILLDKKDKKRFKDITLMKISQIKLNNKLIGKIRK